MRRLKQITEKRENWREQIEHLKQMHQWVLDAEYILGGNWVETGEQGSDKKEITNKEVSLRFDTFLQELEQKLIEDVISQTERKCLQEFLRVFHNARPYLIQCYDLDAFPRTNNEMEGAIRKIKTRYRRITGRKHWGTYLLRYGRSIAFYEWWNASPERWEQFERLAQKIDREDWKQIKKETLSAQSEQLKRFRFRHKREAFLITLEERWASASETATLH